MAVLCAFLTAACGFDYCRRRIPNCLIVIMAAAGFVFRGGREGIGGVFAYAGEALLIMALLYPFFKIGALGAGDVKLFGVTAGYLPFKKILFFSFVSMLITAIISLVKLLRKKYLKERLGILFAYLKKTADSGVLGNYPSAEGQKDNATVCLSGPALLSVLLLLGGVY